MDLSEISQYSHKIRKVNIKNENTNSQYNWITIKIAINDKEDNEIIRFSMQENSNWITHQSNEDDYFLRIPNSLNSTISIFIHYFPSALYDYLEDQHIFSIYDWTELLDSDPISQYNNKTYLINDGYAYVDNNMYLSDGNQLHYKINNVWHTETFNNNNYITGITINDDTYHIRGNKLIKNGEKYNINFASHDINRYSAQLDTENKLVVRSLLTNSIDTFKNPNYKNYTKLVNDDEDVSNQTEQGFFPLSSRYRSYKYITAPDIKTANPLAYWQHWKQAGKPTHDCTRSLEEPYWEVHIDHKGLSPLIAEQQDGEYYPINVYLNYEYLPSSTEYHQHYYGFEPAEANTYKYSRFTVLDGENLTTVNNQFGNESTYRIINEGNPFDDKHEMTVNHYHEELINLKKGIPHNCLWEKNKCDDYYIYTPRTPQGENGRVSINVELNEGEQYRLQYYMYIPSESFVEYNSCYVEIEHEDMFGNVTHIDSVSSNNRIKKILLNQDKVLRDQWIFHEIDFIARQNNRISIVGPQHDEDTINIQIGENETYTKHEPYDLVNEDKIFFTRFKLIRMEEYSPTLKYAGSGLYLVEQNQWTFKNAGEITDNTCHETDMSQRTEWGANDTEDDERWYKKQKPLPMPIKDVYIIFGDDFEILYNKITSELTWTPHIKDCVFDFINKPPYQEYGNENSATEGYLCWETEDDKISLIYDSDIDNTKYENNTIPNNGEGENTSTGRLTLYREQHKRFTTGINNYFTLKLQDSNGNPIIRGEVTCDIVIHVEDPDLDGYVETASQDTVMSLGTKPVDSTGTVTYTKLNFKTLHPNQAYYLRIKYTNVCYDKDIVVFKKIFFEQERRNMNAYVNEDKACSSSVCMCTYTHNCSTGGEASNCNKVACSEYDNEEGTYKLKYKNNYTVENVDTDLPIHIDVNIYNQLNTAIDEGYCELSINDEVIQSTYVDVRGLADFYIDFEDIYKNENENYHNYRNDKHNIKIEYFDKYNNAVNYLYFDLTYTQDFDTRPAIPIKLYSIGPESTIPTIINEEYRVNREDIFMLNIDTEGHPNVNETRFRISFYKNSVYQGRIDVERDKVTFAKNDIFIEYTGNSIIIIDSYDQRNKDTYKIVTQSSTGPTGPYRKYTQTFDVRWVNE